MANEFSGKVAIITGGASGLGAELARQLVDRQATVIIADIAGEKAKEIAAGLGKAAHAATVDVSNREEVDSLVQKVKSDFGALHLFFNNAGISIYGEACDVPFSDWQRVLNINLMGVIYGSLAAYRVMKEQHHGKIVNIASASVFSGDPLFASYVTSKCGVVGLSRVLAIEAEQYGVSVSVVCPGNIRTPLLNEKEPSWLTPAIPVERAAQSVLRGVARDQRIIVFPFRWRVVSWIDRLSPALLNPLRRIIVRRARSRKGTD
jgi:NAD(P)-dependent dehydrogenase (short-subunit alcohol dehydrogenase family)